jgi:hypothetical protein
MSGTAVFDERHKWVAALDSGRSAAFLVTGPEKREIPARPLQGGRDLWSAGLAVVGKMRLFADTAAARRHLPQ